MLKTILERIWKDKSQTMTLLLKIVEENMVKDKIQEDRESEKLTREMTRLSGKLDNLLELRLDGKISTEKYEEKEQQIQNRMNEIKEMIGEKETQKQKVTVVEQTEDATHILTLVKQNIKDIADLDRKSLSEELVDNIVSKIIPTEEGIFKWYLDYKAADILNQFNPDKFAKYDSFTLKFEEAKAYRKKYGNFIRARQWNDLQVEVYLRVD